jgi:hypothetical protein
MVIGNPFNDEEILEETPPPHTYQILFVKTGNIFNNQHVLCSFSQRACQLRHARKPRNSAVKMES